MEKTVDEFIQDINDVIEELIEFRNSVVDRNLKRAIKHHQRFRTGESLVDLYLQDFIENGKGFE